MSNFLNSIKSFFETPAQTKLEALEKKKKKSHLIWSTISETNNTLTAKFNSVYELGKAPNYETNPEYIKAYNEYKDLLSRTHISRSEYAKQNN